jgi:hypothetical protein
MTGLLISKLPLVDAKAVEARINAALNTIVLLSVANFMTAPYFFPEVGRETARGGPADDPRKNFKFLRELPTINAPGFSKSSVDKP